MLIKAYKQYDFLDNPLFCKQCWEHIHLYANTEHMIYPQKSFEECKKKSIQYHIQPERSKREDLDCECPFAKVAFLHDPRCGTLNIVETQ